MTLSLLSLASDSASASSNSAEWLVSPVTFYETRELIVGDDDPGFIFSLSPMSIHQRFATQYLCQSGLNEQLFALTSLQQRDFFYCQC